MGAWRGDATTAVPAGPPPESDIDHSDRFETLSMTHGTTSESSGCVIVIVEDRA